MIQRASRAVRRAKLRFANFTGHKGEVVGTVDMPHDDVLVIVGQLDGLLYTTVRDGKQESYVHQFAKGARPTLCVSADGKRTIVLGGKYKFTHRGYEDFK